MSRFIKYASNLLDGVDSMAKDSLTDQGNAASIKSVRARRTAHFNLYLLCSEREQTYLLRLLHSGALVSKQPSHDTQVPI